VGYTYPWLLSLIGQSLRTGRGRLSSNASFFNFQLSTVNLLRAVLLMSAASAILKGQE
jgi:hypothetical protein